MKLHLAVLAFGAGFGFVLRWAHLDDPDVIYAMLRLREPDVFLLMGSAIATATIGMRLLRARNARSLIGGAPVSWRILWPQRDHVVGSALFGIGWSVANTCPGPIAVQLGTGTLNGLFAAAGLMAGIALRDLQAERTKAPRPVPATEATGVAAPGL